MTTYDKHEVKQRKKKSLNWITNSMNEHKKYIYKGEPEPEGAKKWEIEMERT